MWRQSELEMRVVFMVGISCFVSAAFGSPRDEDKVVAEARVNRRVATDAFPDQMAAETGGGGDPSRGAKYFMYAHQPDKKQYEFGFKRGNGKHSVERYEKAGPNHNFKTKVRWQDEKGGHGEHYWDYNHAPKHGHHDGGHHKGGGGKGHGEGYSSGGHGYGHGYGHGHGGGHHSEPVPEYVEAESASASISSTPSEELEDSIFEASDVVKSSEILKRLGREKKPSGLEPGSKYDEGSEDLVTNSPSAFPRILGFDPYVPPAMAMRSESRPHINKVESRNQITEREKVDPTKDKETFEISPKIDPHVPKLAYDIDTGRVYEENTDTWFKLVPVQL